MIGRLALSAVLLVALIVVACHPSAIGRLARLLDWFDDRVWHHRSYGLCVWIEAHYPEE